MTDLQRNPHFLSWPHKAAATPVTALSVERLSHAARFLLDCPPNADVVVLESADAVTPYMDTIDALAASSTDSNPLFEAATLAAAMTHLQSGGPVRVALVWSEPSNDGTRILLGAFPYQMRRGYLGLPLRVWTIWTHIHGFLATPLVRAGHERAAIRRFLRFADQSSAPLMRFPLFEADGAFGPALADVLGERALPFVETGRRERALPFVETGRHERAFLKSDLDGDAYLAVHMRKKKRKEYNRQWNRFAEMGDLKFEANDGGELDGWLERFFWLERSGWKGKRGTALAERPNERAFFEAMCRDARTANKFHAAQITLDGKPVAMLASFVAGGGAYSFKIAYDEAYARFSPGAQLMMRVIGAFHDDPRISWVDSCAIPNHPMIDHIWAERRAIREVNAATSHRLSAHLVAYSARATHLAERGWSFARAVYHRLRRKVEHEQAH
ncbi:MAG TPA: GNAT family N-acetyltransferase [Parvibaculum sp.]